MTFRTYATGAVALTATLLFCALVSLTLNESEAVSGAGLRPVRTGAKAATISVIDAAAVTSAIPVTKNPAPRLAHTELTQKIASMRDMHSRIAAATTPEARNALLPESDQLMQEGLALMRSMKPGLPASESGEIDAPELTAKQSESVRDFLDLMEALIAMKGDQDSATKTGTAGTAGPGGRLTAIGPSLVRTHEVDSPELVS